MHEQPPGNQDELRRLREENARLKALLTRHGISWEEANQPETAPASAQAAKVAAVPRSVQEKIALFRRLFRGREDVFARRWESGTKSGYAPACGNEWRPGLCRKPRMKCGDCEHRLLLPITDQVIHDHLSGKQTIGVYPLLPDDACRFLAVDFDGSEPETWREDAGAFMQSCRDLDIPAALEISRSGRGAHVWIFFAEAVPAREARHLGSALISRTCARARHLSLTSYDRLFPNQDTMPRGGFGNLIALPLQKRPRERGRSVLVDERWRPCPDQWGVLASIRAMSRRDLQEAVLRAGEGSHPLDVAFVDDDVEPWRRPRPSPRLPGPLPKSLSLMLANRIFILKADLPQPLANRLARLAAFPNPEFHRAQAMRLPVWNKPRVIGCAENHARHISLPRGCLEAALALLRDNGVRPDLRDERLSGRALAVHSGLNLSSTQEEAARAMLGHDMGVLCAPTAFGKTVVAAAIIAERRVSTLVLVHRAALLGQWRARMAAFLDLPEGCPGLIGGGKKQPTGLLDIAVVQSLVRCDKLGEMLDSYGQIIVDECHHIAAFSFEAILKESRAKHVLGLTATPERRDGHHPIIFMQCGPIRHHAGRPEGLAIRREVRLRTLPAPQLSPDAPIQEVFRALAGDAERNLRLAADMLAAYREGRKVLALTERSGHLPLLVEAVEALADAGEIAGRCFVLHGRQSKRRRAAVFAELEALDDAAPRIVLATGRLIGEGFDHPPLDTLVLSLPISWKGALMQYAGRLHRAHAGKQDLRIHDYADDHPQLLRMWRKRRSGYQNMGYRIEEVKEAGTGLPLHTLTQCR